MGCCSEKVRQERFLHGEGQGCYSSAGVDAPWNDL